MSGWLTDTYPTPWGVHVRPADDVIDHDIQSTDCLCGPTVEWMDPKTGLTYMNGPLVTHHSLGDGVS